MNANPAPQPTPNPPSDFQWELDENGGVVITDLVDEKKAATEIVVPAEIDGRPVVALRKYAFYACRSLTSVALPDGLQNIGNMAFGMCSSLTEFIVSSDNSHFRVVDGVLFTADGKTLVAYPAGNTRTKYVVPDGVEIIGAGAFYECKSLTSVALPDGLQNIGDRAFNSCCSLMSVALPGGLQNIGYCAFACCCSLMSVALPDGLQTVSATAFHACSSLTEFTLSSANEHFRVVDGVLFTADGKTLVAYPVGNARSEYVVPDGVETIGDCAFSWCDLTSIEFQDGLQTIGDCAFSECDSLTSVAFPDSLKTIDACAFRTCESLTSIAFPDGLQTIGDYAFAWCGKLTSVALSDGLQTIGDNAFDNCDPNLTFYCFKDSFAQEYAESNNFNFVNFVAKPPAIKNDETPPNNSSADETPVAAFKWEAVDDGVKIVEFLDDGATKVVVPAKIDGRPVTHIAGRAFKGSDSITEFAVSGKSKIFTADDGVLYSRVGYKVGDFLYKVGDFLALERYPTGRRGELVIINDARVLERYPHLEELVERADYVVEQMGLTQIADFAFYGCEALTKVTLIGAFDRIGSFAFVNCSSLKEFSVYGAIREIADWPPETYDYWNTDEYGVFDGCYALSKLEIYAEESDVYIGNSAFRDCNALSNVTICAQSIEFGARYDYWDINHIDDDPSESIYGYGAFESGLSHAVVQLVGNCQFGNSSFANAGLQVLNIDGSAHLNRLYVQVDLSRPGEGHGGCVLNDGSTPLAGSSLEIFNVSGGVYIAHLYNGEDLTFGCPRLKAFSAGAVSSDVKYFTIGSSNLTTFRVANFNARRAEELEAHAPNLTFYTNDLRLVELAKRTGASVESLTDEGVISNDGRFAIVPLKDGVEIVRFLDFAASSLEIPDEIGGRPVTKIGDGAFWDCASLTSIALPVGLQTIGDRAFDDCADDLTLYGSTGSVAMKYAEANGLRFEAR